MGWVIVLELRNAGCLGQGRVGLSVHWLAFVGWVGGVNSRNVFSWRRVQSRASSAWIGQCVMNSLRGSP